jgi:hypothetical protein
MFKLITLLALFFCVSVKSQNIKDSTIYAPIFSLNYAFQIPANTLLERFGTNNNLGFSGGIKTKSNWTYELSASFIFGTNVKDTTIIDHLQNNQNWIINQFGEESVVLIQERGQVFSFKIGKIINVIGPNPNSGLILNLGIGWMRHKIRIDNENDQIPQLSQQHLPYYDRLASGLTLYQFIGYHHMSNNRLTNFYLGMEFYQGFTKGRRDYQIDTMEPSNEKRLDLLNGFRIGWIVPVFRQAPNDFYLD